MMGMPVKTAGEPDAQPALAGTAGADDTTGRENMQQLIQLRWIAVMGQIVTIAVVHFGFKIRLPLDWMSAVLAGLIAFNISSQLHWQDRHKVTNGELFFAL